MELPKIRKQVDGLEQYVMRSLKNQLNGDNKLSQTNISKVKKSYEEFLITGVKKSKEDEEQEQSQTEIDNEEEETAEEGSKVAKQSNSSD